MQQRRKAGGRIVVGKNKKLHLIMLVTYIRRLEQGETGNTRGRAFISEQLFKRPS